MITASCRLDLHGGARIGGWAAVEAGQRARFAVESQPPRDLDPRACTDDEIDRRLEETLDWWRRWSAGTTADGPYAGAGSWSCRSRDTRARRRCGSATAPSTRSSTTCTAS